MHHSTESDAVLEITASGKQHCVGARSHNATATSFYLNFGFEFVGFDTAAYSNEDIEKKEIRLELGLKLWSEAS